MKTTPGTGRSHIPQGTFYDANEELYFYKLICDRVVSVIIQAFDGQDSKDMRRWRHTLSNNQQPIRVSV